MKGGGCSCSLTSQQALKLRKSFMKKRGTSIKFSRAQLRHNQIHGGGIWSSLKSGVSKAYQKFKPIGKRLLDNGLVIAENAASRLADKALAKLEEKAANQINGYADRIENKLNSYGAPQKTYAPGRTPKFNAPGPIAPPDFHNLDPKSTYRDDLKQNLITEMRNTRENRAPKPSFNNPNSGALPPPPRVPPMPSQRQQAISQLKQAGHKFNGGRAKRRRN